MEGGEEMFQLGIRGHDAIRSGSPQEMADCIASQHIENVQLALPISFPEYDKEGRGINAGMGNYFKKVMTKKGINISILSCYINMIHPDVKEREKQLWKFKQYLRYASSFGCHIVASETGNVFPKIEFTEENFTDQAFEELVSVIRDLVIEAEKCGVMLGIEPGLNHPVYSIDRVTELIEKIQSSSLQIILDPANLVNASNCHLQNNLIDEAFRRFGSRIVAVHLKDYLIKEDKLEIVPIGEGMVDFEYFVSKVNEQRPGCYMIMEETPLEYVSKVKKKF